MFCLSLQIVPIILVCCTLWYKVYSYFAFHCQSPLANKVIIVTGCDTGFGNAIAKQLGSMGAIVFATCLQHKTCAKLNNETGDNVFTKLMDVTNIEQIHEIGTEISKYLLENKTYLYGIVNNAGIAEASPFECIPARLFNKVIEVNMMGTSNVCREFIPLMRNNRNNPYLSKNTENNNDSLFGLINRGKGGRIVNIASIAGRISAPYLSAYHASKHAVVGFTDSIRYEMQELFNIWACTIEPSFTNTPLLTKGMSSDAFLDKWKSTSWDSGLGNMIKGRNNSGVTGSDDHGSDIMNVYNIDNWISFMDQQNDFTMSIADQNTTNVVNSVLYGLSSVFPLRWYYPTWQARILIILDMFPRSLTDIIVKRKFFKQRIVK